MCNLKWICLRWYSIQELNNTSEAIEEPSSLLEAYHLKDEAGMTTLDGGSKDETNKFYKETEVVYFFLLFNGFSFCWNWVKEFYFVNV